MACTQPVRYGGVALSVGACGGAGNIRKKSKSMKTSRVVRLSASKNSYSMPIHNAQMTMTLAFHFETLKLA